MNLKVLSVSKLNNYIKKLFNNDVILNNLIVEGEISNFKNHTSGHLYFLLKDNESRISCVMFRSNAETLTFNPINGKKVVVEGYVALYEKNGQYQLYVKEIRLKGEGNLFIQFEQLKKKLSDKGYFDSKRKLQIPFFSKRIAVVTSETGAALRDIVSITKRRNKTVKLFVFPVLVQGENAKYDIAKAIEIINKWNLVDIIILGRGGGSIEELWAFNEEIVAKSIYNSKLPVISAVGHETDFTISDFVADLRAPTPSAAAELVVPTLTSLQEKLYNYKSRLIRVSLSKLEINKRTLNEYKNNYIFKRPCDYLNEYKLQLDGYSSSLINLLKDIIYLNRIELLNLKSKLNSLNPKDNNFNCLVMNLHGKSIRSIKQLKMGEKIDVVLQDGIVRSKIIDINEGGE
ncbi:MAG: exodeoxyribonuclease VII large subunit [Eubacteriaceae bacterium]